MPLPAAVRKRLYFGGVDSAWLERMQPALALVDRLKQERGMSENEAFEVAVEAILAPADGPASSDNPPGPMEWEEQKTILEGLGFR